MPILTKCEKCKRLGGYAVRAEDELCARCKKLVKPEEHKKNKDEDNE